MAIETGEPRLFRNQKATLGESLVWNPEGDMLWCDIAEGKLHRSPEIGNPFGMQDRAAILPAPLASFHQTVDGGYVVSLGDRVVLADSAGEVVRDLATIEHAVDGMRLNEGKVDPFGRWVTGSLDPSGESHGVIYAIDPDGSVQVLVRGIGTANGFEWSRDGRTMYFSDTDVQTIYRADYSLDSELSNIEVVTVGHSHDGATMDAEGYLWTAIYGEGRVMRFSPDGKEDLSIALPAPNVTSVAFGGDDLSVLYVASARENMSPEELRSSPMSGAIFSIQTNTHGFLPYRFGQPGVTAAD
ncbi:MAG: SMP-30/gluconolactonase/LRE family protein [Glaciihabitans sp.]